LFIALVLIIDKEPKVVYLIPSKQLSQRDDDDIFFENEVSLMTSLSNWEIKVFVKGIPELSKFALNNIVGQL
jgi:hypothetical protein